MMISVIDIFDTGPCTASTSARTSSLPRPVRDNYAPTAKADDIVPFPFDSAASLLHLCQRYQLNIAELMIHNELALHPAWALKKHLQALWAASKECISRGLTLQQEGEEGLPGNARLRAEQLGQPPDILNDPFAVLDWLNVYALAICEENQEGGKVITGLAPGSGDLLIAVLCWYDKFINPIDDDRLTTAFLTATAMVILYQTQISAEHLPPAGQADIACSLAAAALVALWDGSPEQVCMAAELALQQESSRPDNEVKQQTEQRAMSAANALNAACLAVQKCSTSQVNLDHTLRSLTRPESSMPIKGDESLRVD